MLEMFETHEGLKFVVDNHHPRPMTSFEIELWDKYQGLCQWIRNNTGKHVDDRTGIVDA